MTTIIMMVLMVMGQTDVSFGAGETAMDLKAVAERVAEAEPGTVVELGAGVYRGDDVVLVGKGTADARVVVRPEDGAEVVFASAVAVEANYLTIEGVRFEEDGGLEIEGTGVRVLRCAWNDAKSKKWVRVKAGSRQIEIAHCVFENKTNNREHDRGCQLMQVVVRNEGEAHHIHHNRFADVPKGKSNNGYETVQLITEGNPWDPEPGDSETVIEHNVFERCSGEAEIISVKSNGNVLRHNTFRASGGSLVLRHGDGNVVYGNLFFGDGEPRAGGVRMQGEDQVVVNNLFRGLRSFGVGMMDGTPDDLYMRTQRALVAFNTFVGCSPGLRVGMNHSKHPNGTAPKDCVIANNLFILNDPDQPRSDREMKTVELVQGDEPENWTWEGNVTEMPIGMPQRPGLDAGQAEMVWLADGWVAPAVGSDLATGAKGSYDRVETDALGKVRGERTAVGCLEARRR